MLIPVLEQEQSVLTISELNAGIKSLLENTYPFIWVKGEISNFRVPASGHYYFTLKDERSQIRAVFFRQANHRLRFIPESGMQVLCQGRIGVYEPRGEYQIIVDSMEPHGIGALQIAFEQLKRKLEAEGLFDPARKRSLPFCPCEIAIVTSPTGAAIRDMLKVLKRSPYPLGITLFPVRVQGREACGEIAAAIELATSLADRFGWDLVIVGRGGGSVEDLWPFNEEVVARALSSCCVPTISAVGHEIDLTISDLIADFRAPTPTAAAEWVVSRLESFIRDLARLQDRMCQRITYEIDAVRQRLNLLEKGLIDPKRRLEDLRLTLDDRINRLNLSMARRIEKVSTLCAHASEKLHMLSPEKRIQQCRAVLNQQGIDLALHYQKLLNRYGFELQKYSSRLGTLNPISVLARGYSITYRQCDGEVVRRSSDVQPGQEVRVRLSEGSLECTVKSTGALTVFPKG